MKIKPKENYKNYTTGVTLDKDKVYMADWATNQPEWKERKQIFVLPMKLLLRDYEYEIQD